MASKFMQVFVSNAAHECAELLPLVIRHQVKEKHILRFCAGYRTIGIGVLFMFGDAPSFQRNLFKSARAFAHYLQMASDDDKVTSRFKPFFDAVAALDFDGAREIAARARETRHELEYEEDFLFVHFLMTRFFTESSDKADEKLLARWEKVLEGAPDPRLDVCRALLAKDSDAFDEAMELHLAELKAKNKRLVDKEVLAMDEAATEAKLSVEGLALVVLAQRAGMKTQRDYLFIPSLARLRTPPAFPPDAWMTVQD